MSQRPDAASRGAEATAVARKDETMDRLADLIASAKDRIEAGDLEGGLVAFRRIAEENPTIPEVFNNLGAICAAMGRREEAEAAFTRATLLQPTAPNPWYNRGLMRFQGGHFSGALDDFLEAASLDPNDPVFRNNCGVAHFQLRDFDLAREAFQAAADLQPGYVAAQLNLIDVDLAEGKLEAAHAAARALAATNDDPEVNEKVVECSIHVAVKALEEAQSECEASLARQDGSDALLDQANRVLRAKQALLGEDGTTIGASAFEL